MAAGVVVTNVTTTAASGPSQSVIDYLSVYVAQKGFQVLGAIIILLIGVLATRWIGRVLERSLQKKEMEPPVRMLILRVNDKPVTSVEELQTAIETWQKEKKQALVDVSRSRGQLTLVIKPE